MDTNLSPAGAEGPMAMSKPKARKRNRLRVVGIVVIGFIALILALPTMLGSRWIYQPLINRLAMDQFQLDIESIKLRWFSPLEFQGISIRQSEGLPAGSHENNPLVSIRSIKSNRGLLAYLLNGRNLGQVEINEPKLDIALLEDGSNLERLVKSIEGEPSDSAPKSNSRPKLDLDLAVRNLSVQVMPVDGRRALEGNRGS